MIYPEKAKIEIIIPAPYQPSDEIIYDCTLDVEGWEDWEVKFERAVLETSVKTTSFPFIFTGGAYDVLKTQFNKYYQNAQGKIRITNFAPEIIQYFDLDFSTYNEIEAENRIELSCREQDIRSVVKSNGNTKYDIPLIDVQIPQTLNFSGVQLDNIIKMRAVNLENYTLQRVLPNTNLNGVNWNFSPTTTVSQYSGFTFLDSDTPIKDRVTTQDTLKEFYWDIIDTVYPKAFMRIEKAGNYKMSYLSDTDMIIWSCKISIRNTWNSFLSVVSAGGIRAEWNLYKRLIDDENEVNTNPLIRIATVQRPDNIRLFAPSESEDLSVPVSGAMAFRVGYANHAKGTELLSFDGFIESGYEIIFETKLKYNFTYNDLPGTQADWSYCFCNIGNFICEYKGITAPKTYRCTDIPNLMLNIIERMGYSGVTNTVLEDTLTSGIVLVPHDVLNGYSEPKITLDFNSVVNFLKLNCLTYRVEGDTLYIQLITGQNGVYDRNNIEAFNFSEEECADLQISPYTEIQYSEINVNYQKNNVEGINEKKEFNRTTNYTTKSNSNNKLELSTNIRTDSVGFALSIPELENDSNERKDDIWAIWATKTGTVVSPITVTVNGKQEGFFNSQFLPANIIARWWGLLAGWTNVASFSSSECIDDLEVDGTNTRRDCYISFTANDTLEVVPDILPVMYDVATSDDKNILAPLLLNGCLSFNYKDETFLGFALDIGENPLRRQTKEIKLVKRGEAVPFGSLPFQILPKQNVIGCPAAGKNITVAISVFGAVADSIRAEWSDTNQNINPISITRLGSELIIRFNVLANSSTTSRKFGVDLTVYFGGIVFNTYTVCTISQEGLNPNNVTVSPQNYTFNFELNDSMFDSNLTIKQNNGYRGVLIDLLGADSSFSTIRSVFNTGRWRLAGDDTAGVGGTFTVPGKWAYKVCNVAVSTESKPGLNIDVLTVYGRATLENNDKINPHAIYPQPVTPVIAVFGVKNNSIIPDSNSWAFAPVINFKES